MSLSKSIFPHVLPMVSYDALCSQRLISAKKSAQEQLDSQRSVLADLDELADIIADMLERQEGVEVGGIKTSELLS